MRNIALSAARRQRVLVHRATLSACCSTSERGFSSKINPDDLEFHKTQIPKEKPDLDNLDWGAVFSDHMLSIDWSEESGWEKPKIIPYGEVPISPASPALNYGLQCFEGMKAYKDSKGRIRLFRPDANMKRLNYSMTRLAMPPLEDDGFLECIKKLLKIEIDWIPPLEGYSIYLRPIALGTAPYLGVKASNTVKLLCILSPVGPYYKSGFKPVKLLADTNHVRAWPGGVGNAKVGGNYAPTMEPAKRAFADGFHQICWLFGPNDEITEVGAMNIFFAMHSKTKEDVIELVTPSLDRGDILPGVTRSSIIELARSWTHEGKKVEVVEKVMTMAELVEAESEGRIFESFCSGTGAVVMPIEAISYRGRLISFPASVGGCVGPFAERAYEELKDIHHGKVDGPAGWSVLVE